MPKVGVTRCLRSVGYGILNPGYVTVLIASLFPISSLGTQPALTAQYNSTVMNETHPVKRLDIQFPQELVPDRDGTVQRFDSTLEAPPSRWRVSSPRVLEL